MEHFRESQLADFVRGVARPSEFAAMEGHVSSGCRKCGQTVSILRKVAAAGRAEAEFQPPENVLHSVRAMFALQQPEKVYLSPRIVCRLIYDSFREPLPAGVRARQRLVRHVLYQAADYSLDLRLEHQRGTSGVALVGQLADQREPDRPLADLPVLLVCGKEVVARAASNAFGEFQVEYLPKPHLRLHIQTNRNFRDRIEVPLSRLESVGGAPDRLPRRQQKQKR